MIFSLHFTNYTTFNNNIIRIFRTPTTSTSPPRPHKNPPTNNKKKSTHPYNTEPIGGRVTRNSRAVPLSLSFSYFFLPLPLSPTIRAGSGGGGGGSSSYARRGAGDYTKRPRDKQKRANHRTTGTSARKIEAWWCFLSTWEKREESWLLRCCAGSCCCCWRSSASALCLPTPVSFDKTFFLREMSDILSCMNG